jgi:hypothetical protein
MKMHFTLITLLLSLFISSKMIAQSTENDSTSKNFRVKLTFSNEYENEKIFTDVRYIMRDEKGNIYCIKTGHGFILTTKSYIEKYTPDMKRVFVRELMTNQTKEKDLNIVSAFTFNDKAYVFADYYNKVKERRYLFALKVQDDGSMGKPQKIADFESEEYAGSFLIKMSKDSSKLMIVSQLPIDKKNLKLPVVFTILDKEFTEIWKGKSDYDTEKKGRTIFKTHLHDGAK